MAQMTDLAGNMGFLYLQMLVLKELDLQHFSKENSEMSSILTKLIEV